MENQIPKITYIYTDGSVINNGKHYAIGGYGVFFGDNDPKNISKPFTIYPITTPRTELYAVLQGILTFIRSKGRDFFLTKDFIPEEIHIYSDSSYVVNIFDKWLYGWKRNGWKNKKGNPVLNKELISQIDEYMNAILPQVKTKIFHLNSHRRAPRDKNSMDYQHWYGNDRADLLATRGRNISVQDKRNKHKSDIIQNNIQKQIQKELEYNRKNKNIEDFLNIT